MSNFRVFLSIVSAIVLFLYGLGAFSQEIQTVGGETLKKWSNRRGRLSGMKEEEQQQAALREAKKLLIECGEYKNAETARLREDAAKK